MDITDRKRVAGRCALTPELFITTIIIPSLFLAAVSTSIAENPNAESPTTATIFLPFPPAVSRSATAAAMANPRPTPIVAVDPESRRDRGASTGKNDRPMSSVLAPSETKTWSLGRWGRMRENACWYDIGNAGEAVLARAFFSFAATVESSVLCHFDCCGAT